MTTHHVATLAALAGLAGLVLAACGGSSVSEADLGGGQDVEVVETAPRTDLAAPPVDSGPDAGLEDAPRLDVPWPRDEGTPPLDVPPPPDAPPAEDARASEAGPVDAPTVADVADITGLTDVTDVTDVTGTGQDGLVLTDAPALGDALADAPPGDVAPLPDVTPDAGRDAGRDATALRDGSNPELPWVLPDGIDDATRDAETADGLTDAPAPADVPDTSGPEAILGEADVVLPPLAVCEGAYGTPPEETGRLDTIDIPEASGIAASGIDPRILWTHNDAGHPPVLYAVRTDGRLIASVRLADVPYGDLEDLASAPCPDGTGTCLWVGDIGNNALTRKELRVHVLREPTLPASTQPVDLAFAPDWTFPYEYPEDTINSEGLAVAPDGSTFYIFEKADRAEVRVFRHPGPFVSGTAAVLEEVALFPAPGFSAGGSRLITGADLHRSGTRLILRCYGGTGEYRFAEGQGIADLAVVPWTRILSGPSSEPQGEAVGYDAEGAGFWTISEVLAGFQPLHHYPCLP